MDFLKRYEDMGEIFDPLQVEVKQTIRINTLKINEEDLIKRLKKRKVKLKKIEYLKNGYTYDADFSLASTPEYLQGYFYIQDAASQASTEALNPKPNETILDMAASPGGKCSHITQLMNNTGKIIALEENKTRIQSLINNLERLSVTNTIIFKKDARFADDLKIKFDKILLDAPCGGNFCIEPNYFKTRTKKDLESKARAQKELLIAAQKSLKDEGILVYSTCSLEIEENELIIDWLTKKFTNMKLQEININAGKEGITEFDGKQLNPELKKTKRFWPHKTNTGGFFIAKIKKCK